MTSHSFHIRGTDLNNYKDQTDVFYASPVAYLQDRFPLTVDPSFPPSPFPTSIAGSGANDIQAWKHEWPQNIVLFGSLLEIPALESLLQAKGYGQVWDGEGGWDDDPRRRGGVQVWRFMETLAS